MSDWHEVSKTGDLADGTMKTVDVAGRQILLARVGDRYYAVDNRCPHLGGNLSAGTLQGTVVTCPLHHSQFDLVDGHVVQWTDWAGLLSTVSKALKPPRPLKTYEIKVEGDRVLLSGL
jgi:3-phenylpropionate/trans-cinnamate dioxygenase ferredoxin subunit